MYPWKCLGYRWKVLHTQNLEIAKINTHQILDCSNAKICHCYSSLQVYLCWTPSIVAHRAKGSHRVNKNTTKTTTQNVSRTGFRWMPVGWSSYHLWMQVVSLFGPYFKGNQSMWNRAIGILEVDPAMAREHKLVFATWNTDQRLWWCSTETHTHNVYV